MIENLVNAREIWEAWVKSSQDSNHAFHISGQSTILP